MCSEEQMAMELGICEEVYDTLTGNLIAEYCLPWVEDIFVPGHPYFESYACMHQAYDRLRLRLGDDREDPDVEEIISCLLEHGKEAALKMFEYGRKYERMQETQRRLAND